MNPREILDSIEGGHIDETGEGDEGHTTGDDCPCGPERYQLTDLWGEEVEVLVHRRPT